ncbi:unnamed protein product [Thlaspi arvense]|uniref:Uncharacterized protein n=1 Tax=Thlaspi arvense TaxID=13288 RepID=A0AAU9RTX9_THLAR|nr:unnamed protein product [Thlaspi arvense]
MQNCSTGFRMGTSGAGSSETSSVKKKFRRRPSSTIRKEQKAQQNAGVNERGTSENTVCESLIKRKAEEFMWRGTRYKQTIFSRLDRCFENPEWYDLFPSAHQWFLERLGSDHRPVLVKFMGDRETFRSQLHFDKRWAEDPLFKETVKEAWNGSSIGGIKSTMARIANCRRAFSHWKRKKGSNSTERIKYAREELEYEEELRTLMNINLKVSDLIDHGTGNWDMQVLHDLFTREDIALIKKHRPMLGREDGYTWAKTKNSMYTVMN